eukprot:COSAG02_NODE_3892_length_6074_cov_5.045690_6_plen_44_part_00
MEMDTGVESKLGLSVIRARANLIAVCIHAFHDRNDLQDSGPIN